MIIFQPQCAFACVKYESSKTNLNVHKNNLNFPSSASLQKILKGWRDSQGVMSYPTKNSRWQIAISCCPKTFVKCDHVLVLVTQINKLTSLCERNVHRQNMENLHNLTCTFSYMAYFLGQELVPVTNYRCSWAVRCVSLPCDNCPVYM